MKKVRLNQFETCISEIRECTYTDAQNTALCRMFSPMCIEATPKSQTAYGDAMHITTLFPIKLQKKGNSEKRHNTYIGKFPEMAHPTCMCIGGRTPPPYDHNRNRIRYVRKNTAQKRYQPNDHFPTALASAILCVTGVPFGGGRTCEQVIIRRVFVDHMLIAGYSHRDIKRNTRRDINTEEHAATHKRRRLQFDGYRALVDMLNEQIERCLRGKSFCKVDMLAEIAKAKNADGRQWR